MNPPSRTSIDRASRVSVALVTRNRPESLRRCLQSWRNQKVQPGEIVVADDSSEGACREATRGLAEEFDAVYALGPGRGLYANRNHAALACRGEWIFSADDDHTHPEDFLQRAVAWLEEDDSCIWSFGEFSSSHPGIWNSPSQLMGYGAGGIPSDPQDCAAISDGASLYPRAIFDGGLRYDESYRFGFLWYLWGHYLRWHGWRIAVAPEPAVTHHVEVKQAAAPDPVQQRSAGLARLYAWTIVYRWLQPSLGARFRIGVTRLRERLSTDGFSRAELRELRDNIDRFHDRWIRPFADRRLGPRSIDSGVIKK